MPKLLTISLALLMVLGLATCDTTTTNNAKSPLTNPESKRSLATIADSLQTEAECRLNQGDWRKVGRLQAFSCVLPTQDAGKSCTDAKECQVACVLKGKEVQPGTKVTGQCHDSTHQFGCRTYVTRGKAEATLCVD